MPVDMKPLRRSILTAATIAAVALRPWRLSRFEVAERSMSPTLEDGDYLITRRRYSHPCASHALTRSTAGLGRGDIIVFPDEGARYLVKRIVGLPDERVVISGGVVTINGRTLAEPWWHGATTPDGAWEGSPDGYFVMGDNRSASSHDSRSRGSIPATSIDSVVIGRYWPPDRIGRIRGTMDRRA